MQKRLPLYSSTIVLIGIIILFSLPIGPLPALGSFFHPGQGFWANSEVRLTTGDMVLTIDGPENDVEVLFDERSVPHIFAENDHDLYFAQGYITARDRLFQMELQIRAAAGKLSEWLGPDLIPYDQNQRRLGMLYGAEQAMKEIEKDETVNGIIQAYSDGVNAFINTLDYEDYPLEYKILGVTPAAWEPGNSALLLKYMTQMLAGRNDDVRTSNTIAHFGEEFVNRYISQRSSLMDPIVPPGTEWDFDPLDIDKPDETYLPAITDDIELWQPDPLNGSNNWVIDGSKSANGYPILSNDMHLNMTLPAIWYEIQLHTPQSNTYGVSLQGAPTIIVGFNNHIAWGSTNTGADVMDWYEITFRDNQRKEYLHDCEWLPVKERVEEIKVKNGETLQDTILFTHHGPVYESNEETTIDETIHLDHAVRWIGHDPSNELLTFYKLNRAQNYADFRDAFKSYQAPAQNMNFASIDGDIAIQTGGRFPLKWQYQGRSVSDGSDSQYDWNEFIPYEQNPYSVNPERGFLSAANQYPADVDYPYYLGDFFAPFERGRRINDQLRDMESITVDDFKNLLMDSYSYHASTVLPVMLDNIQNDNLDDTAREWLQNLEQWDYWNAGEKIEPSIFYYWWNHLNAAIWNNKYDTEYPMRRPQRDVTVDLILNDPASPLFDNIQTTEIEQLPDLVEQSFLSAFSQMEERFGTIGDSWRWGYVNNTNLGHVGQIPGMGKTDLFTNGGAESINAIRGSHGPSWRMIVELDPEGVRGYGVYPGGQSGNPGSKTYDEFIETWRSGELFDLLFLDSKPESGENFPLTIRFE